MTESYILLLFLFLLSHLKGFLFLSLALKWFRTKGNIQAEVEEMQEEQRSLSSIRTISVWGLLRDRCVRWQVITIMVVNVGMQLSGIDAVRGRSIVVFSVLVCLHVCVCVVDVQRLCSYYKKVRAPGVPSCAPPICISSCSYITVPHAATEWLSRGAQDHGSLSPGPLSPVLPHIRRSSRTHSHTKSNTSLYSLLHVDGSSRHAAHMLASFPSRATPCRVPRFQMLRSGTRDGSFH